MKFIQIAIIYILLSHACAQSQSIKIEGAHKLTQTDDMCLYQAIDKCLVKALANGIYEYLLVSNEYNEEEMNTLMPILDGAIQMCVKDPTIIDQEINGNEIFIKAEGIINPFILNQILNTNN